MTAFIVANGLNDFLKFAEALPEIANEAAFLAVNDTARDTTPAIAQEMRKQIAFPPNYLNKDRLGIRKKANRQNLEAVISGRDRPTSLARFAPRGATPLSTKGKPLRLMVKPGQPVTLKKAFLVNLRNGNTGLAVRLKKGETMQFTEKAVRLADNLYLLYGPSVDQVLQSISIDQAPDIMDRLNRNFLRQFARLSRG